jgi:GntR family transcriptional regulator/MocR family aminotransferase
MHTPIVVARDSAMPLHRQIYDEWRRGILAGRFGPGERVPSTRDLAAALEVSRTTVTAAYDQLTAEGYLESQRGSGTFVCRDLPDDALRPSHRVERLPTPARSVRLSRYGRRLEPVIRRSPSAPGVINLSPSSPDADHFPFRLWRRLLHRHLRHLTPSVLGYSANEAGHERLRREIALYVMRSRAVHCSPDDVIVVNGSQQALDLCARVLVDPGDEVALEHPGYQGARQLFAAHGARLRPVRVTADGIAVRDLPERARLVYVTPSHQFPTGVSMSLARRLELLDWARRRRVAIIEDDYDSEYRYSGAPLPALQGLAGAVPVIYVGTFSNVMFPGLRIGYLIVPPSLVEPFARAKWHADRHTTLLEQAALADFLHDGHLERHVRRMRRLYKRRRDTLIDALEAHFGDGVEVTGDAAGLHVVVRFRSNSVAGSARRNGVQLASTSPYYLSHAPANEYILRFAAVGERALREGVKRLAGGRKSDAVNAP